MAVLLWIVLPLFVAAGSALLAAVVMQARMEVGVARERAATAEARALLEVEHKRFEEQVRAAEESGRRKALDEFIADIRVEERHFLRESRSLFLSRKCLVVQERLYFRNLPISDWIEREFMVEEGGNGAARAIAAGSRKLLP